MDTAFATSASLDGFPAFIIVLSLIAIILLVLVAPWFVVFALLRKRAERIFQQYNQTVITQYDPPHDLRPAEVGFLYDMRCNSKEIRATLCDLGQRGVITIDQQGRVALANKDAFDSLEEYEQIAVRMYDKQTQSLGTTRTEHVGITGLDGHTYQVALMVAPAKSEASFTAAVQRALAKKGYKTRSYRLSFWLRVFFIALLLGFWPLFMFVAFGVTSNGQEYEPFALEAFGAGFFASIILGFFFFPVYLIVAALLLSAWVKIAGRSWLNTKQIRLLWPELEGYRLFLETVDLDNIQFEAATDPTKMTTSTLPYAIVFNLDTKWEHYFQK